ncbi:MAG TPA: hypothetical protein VGX92_09560 [Pyrinomonadaceae bacterium]|jgi:hypothetical protein|nr:hypothetical protein [Pyrinomonadaceae bacterium]
MGAAVCAVAQNGPATKQNERAATETTVTTPAPGAVDAADAPRYAYEFKQPEFYVRHIVVEHDAEGRGTVSFERKGLDEPIVEPLALSSAARGRILALWEALRFLDSDTDYQSSKQFPHMGTMLLRMTKGARTRTAEFNWTHDLSAEALVKEYRRAADQAIFIFDINLSRENQPLNSPKLMDQLDTMLKRDGLSDPQQLIPLLRELYMDERLPLIARNHAERLLKRIEK